jgi:intracellular multiplication protein IcmV
MKNKSGSRIGRLISRVLNVRSWLDWDRMKSFTFYLIDGFKKFFIPQKPNGKNGESFQAAKKRLNLSDSDIMARQIGLLRLSILMILIAVLIFVYSVYLLVVGAYTGGVVALVVTLIAVVLAFRYHFWYFQIRERKLGCTIQEWFKQGLMGDKS